MGNRDGRVIPSLHRATWPAWHVLLLLGALVVPVWAVTSALSGSGDDASASLAPTVQRWWALLQNTAIVAGVSAAVAVACGGLLGFLIARTNLPGRRFLWFLACFAACQPIYVSAVFVFSVIPLWTYAESAAFCGLLYGVFYTPLAVVLLSAAFRAGDAELEDAGRLDGTSRQVLLRITLPAAQWGLATVGGFVLLLVATDYTLTDTLLVRTFAEEVYYQYQLRRSAAGPLLTALPILCLLAALLVGLQWRYRLVGEGAEWQAGRPPRTLRMGRLPRWLLALALLGGLAALLYPFIASVLAKAGPPDVAMSAAWELRYEALTSFLIGGATALILTFSAVGLAWAGLRARRFRWTVWVAVVVLLALPAPVVGIALIELLNRPGLLGRIYDSPAVVVIGQTVRFLPLAILLFAPAVERVPRELELAARVDGADWAAVQRYVYWPAMRVHAPAVAFVLLILSFGEIGVTHLVSPPGAPPLAVRAFTLIHFGVYGDLAVLAMVSAACITLPWAALLLLVRRRK